MKTDFYDTMLNCIISAGAGQKIAEKAVEGLLTVLGGSYIPKIDPAIPGRNKRIIHAWRLGYSSRELSEGYGVSQRTIQRLCKNVPKDLSACLLGTTRDYYSLSLSDGFIDTGDGKK
jgi:hypothetical protein